MRRPRPAELADRLGNLLENPGWVMQLSRAGLDVPAAAASASQNRAKLARQKRQEAQQLWQAKLDLLKEIRGQRLPQGTRYLIRQAQSMDDLIAASSAIQGALSIKNVTPTKLAFAAARGDDQAKQALSLLSPHEASSTVASLARQAAQGDPVAAEAIRIIKDVRGTGVRRRQRGSGDRQLYLPPPPTALKELPGGGVQGTGRPKVKSFRRLP